MNNNYQNNLKIIEIPVEKISPNPFQPRLSFDDKSISTLAESIRQYGVLQPIVVTRKGDDFELVSGERRLRASKLAGLKTIPAIIRDFEHRDDEKFELAIIENLQREDLNPVDKAKAFKKLAEEFNLTHSQIASKLGKSREYISNSLRILSLPDDILEYIKKGEVSEGHAKPLLMLNDKPFEQKELLNKILNHNLSVRSALQLVKSSLGQKKKEDENIDPEIKNIEKKLSEKLGTRVHIDKKNEGEGGVLSIEYFSREDLEKIVNLVKGQGLSSAPILALAEEEDIDESFSAEKKFEESFLSDKFVDEHEEKKEAVLENEALANEEIIDSEIEELESEKTPETLVKDEKEKNIEEIKENESEEKKEDDLDGYKITSFSIVGSGSEDKEEEIDKIDEKIEKKEGEENFEEKREFFEEKREFINNFAIPDLEKNDEGKNKEGEINPVLNSELDVEKGIEVNDGHISPEEIKEEVPGFEGKKRYNIFADNLDLEDSLNEIDFSVKKDEKDIATLIEKKEDNFETKTESNNLQEEINSILSESKIINSENDGKNDSEDSLELLSKENKESVNGLNNNSENNDNEGGSIYQEFLRKKKEAMREKEVEKEINEKVEEEVFRPELKKLNSDFQSNAYFLDNYKNNNEDNIPRKNEEVIESGNNNENENLGIKAEPIFTGDSFIPKKEINEVQDEIVDIPVKKQSGNNEDEDLYKKDLGSFKF